LDSVFAVVVCCKGRFCKQKGVVDGVCEFRGGIRPSSNRYNITGIEEDGNIAEWQMDEQAVSFDVEEF
jgi:hypothetical protein